MRAIITILSLLFISNFAYAEVFKWIDEKGTVHFTEDWEKIPEKYRDQVKRKELPEEPTSRGDRIKEQEMRERSKREYEKIEAEQIRKEKIKKVKEALEAEKPDVRVSYKGKDTGYHIFYITVKNNATKVMFVSPGHFILTEEDNRSVNCTVPSMSLRNRMPMLEVSEILPGGFVEAYLFFEASKRGKTLIYKITGEEFSVR